MVKKMRAIRNAMKVLLTSSLMLAMLITFTPKISVAAMDSSSTATIGTTTPIEIQVPSGVTQGNVADEPTLIESSASTLSAGWYYVGADVTTGTLTISGAVNIILVDGYTLTASGVVCEGDNSITIWGQTGDTGTLSSTATASQCAGIGGRNHIGGSNITINGGTVIAKGNYGAGIGGGDAGPANNITINGGNVTAIGGSSCAGIGSGSHSSYGSGTSGDITINGGTITATGGQYGAGIGAGSEGRVKNIYINGGNITATGGEYGCGIKNSSGDILISGGTIVANGSSGISNSDAAIKISRGNITANGGIVGYTVDIVIEDGTVTAIGGTSNAGIGGSDASVTITGGNVTATGKGGGAGIGGSNACDGGNITISGGTVIATGEAGGAGIGGGCLVVYSGLYPYGGTGSDITITGGNVTATGGESAAGIGGGKGGAGKNITITGGTIIANGGASASGIGDGQDYSGDTDNNIDFSDTVLVRAGASANPTEVILTYTRNVDGKQYVTVENHTHTLVAIGTAKAATCTTDGITAGSKCSVCGRIFAEQEIISATGHDFSGEWKVTKEATATTEGRREKTCKNGCGEKHIETISATGSQEEDPSNGKLDKEAQVAKDAPVESASLDNSKKALMDAEGIFTDDERTAIQNGDNAKVFLTITNVDKSTISTTNQDKIENAADEALGEDPIINYMDVSLFKQVGLAAAVPVHEPETDIEVTIEIPQSMLIDKKGEARKYRILRLHDGEVETITGTFNFDTNEFTFTTDRFSTYAIAYSDEKMEIQIDTPGDVDTITKIGGTIQLGVKVYPLADANQKVTYKSSDESVATVDANGLVTAVGEGEAYITVTTADGAISKTFAIKIDTSSTAATQAATTASTAPKTGDNSNVGLWLFILLCGFSALGFMTISGRKTKKN